MSSLLEFSNLLVCIGIEKDTSGMSTVTSSSSRFLVISFDRFWQRIMYDKPDIWFVNSHSCEKKKYPIIKKEVKFSLIWQFDDFRQTKEIVSNLCHLNLLKPNYLCKRNWRQGAEWAEFSAYWKKMTTVTIKSRIPIVH